MTGTLTREDKLLLSFCTQEILGGRYIPQVRVGRSIVHELEVSTEDTKIVDAVCILSMPHEYKLVGLGNLGNGAATSWTKRIWKAEREWFNGQRIALIEVKSGKLDHSAIGQLLVYRFLFRRDYPLAIVEQLWIVASEDDEFVRPACVELGINVWIKDIGVQPSQTDSLAAVSGWGRNPPSPL